MIHKRLSQTLFQLVNQLEKVITESTALCCEKYISSSKMYINYTKCWSLSNY